MTTRRTFDDLVTLMTTLRSPGGCPWDRQQTYADLKPFIIEEAYEVVDAIDKDDRQALKEELGDMLLEAVFTAEIAREEGSFDIYDSITHVHDKLVRRHPHVFADATAGTADEVLTNWEKLKDAERKEEQKSLLDGVPQSLPALLKAARLTEKAARVGFDWDRTEDILLKLEEELAELREAVTQENRESAEEEIGDLFFTVANIARRLGVNAEEALQKANRKFTSRFQAIEGEVRASGKTFEEFSLDELDAMWGRAKDAERSS